MRLVMLMGIKVKMLIKAGAEMAASNLNAECYFYCFYSPLLGFTASLAQSHFKPLK